MVTDRANFTYLQTFPWPKKLICSSATNSSQIALAYKIQLQGHIIIHLNETHCFYKVANDKNPTFAENKPVNFRNHDNFGQNKQNPAIGSISLYTITLFILFSQCNTILQY